MAGGNDGARRSIRDRFDSAKGMASASANVVSASKDCGVSLSGTDGRANRRARRYGMGKNDLFAGLALGAYGASLRFTS